jgi:hypothetical protein
VAREPGIYVEILINADVNEIWRRTQVPDLHEQWDLRFTKIEYLPRLSEAEPQRFLYSTRIGFGLKIKGEGESTGTREVGILAIPSNSIRDSIPDLVRLSDALRTFRPIARPVPVPAAYRLGDRVEF